MIVLDKGAKVFIPSGTILRGAKLRIASHAELSLGSDSLVQGTIVVDEESKFISGPSFRLVCSTIVLKGHSKVRVGKHCLVERPKRHDGYISITDGSMHVGNNTSLRGIISISPNAKMNVGSNTFINHGSEIRCGESISIGDFVYVSYFSDIFDTNTHPLSASQRRAEQKEEFPNSTFTDYAAVETRPVEIGDDVWIGKHATILKGSNIGARSIIGTRAVVAMSCPPDSLLVGNPARRIGQQQEADCKVSNEFAPIIQKGEE